ncbi:MAG: hypothetical protein AAFQ67_00860 [Pseudomonadota bacterium]
MPLAYTLLNVVLVLAGAAAVIAAFLFKQPLIMVVLFVASGGAFALYASRQVGRAAEAWLPDVE